MTKNNKAVKLARLEGCESRKVSECLSGRIATNWQDRVFAAVDGVIEGIGWKDGGGMYPNTFKIRQGKSSSSCFRNRMEAKGDWSTA